VGDRINIIQHDSSDSKYDDDETWDSKQLPMKMNCDVKQALVQLKNKHSFIS
jgi:hypothetical protein